MTFNQSLRSWSGPQVLVPRDSRRNKSWQCQCGRAPRLETLEDRLAPAVLTVTSSLDGPLASLKGNGLLELREAIQIATAPGTTIDGFSTRDPSNIIRFSSAMDGRTINVTTFVNNGSVGPTAFVNPGTSTLTIDGETGLTRGITITRSSTSPFRLFYNSIGSLTLKGLTLSNGLAKGGDGGVGSGSGGGGAAGLGGAIYNHGTLTIVDSTLSGNTAQGGNGARGGKINGGGGGGGMGGDGHSGKYVGNPFPNGDGAFGLGGDGGGPNQGPSGRRGWAGVLGPCPDNRLDPPANQHGHTE